MKKLHVFLLLYGIIVFAGFLRLYAVNWDGGYHMHPDERAITLSVIQLSLPSGVTEFLSADSPWNPKFFAYGSLPFSLLYLAGHAASLLDPSYAVYDGINLVGRYLSALFDLGTLLFVFLIARRLLSVRFALLAAFFYGISVLPIQLSHFYAVDTLLTFFITGTLHFLLAYYDRTRRQTALRIGIFLGGAMATKISAVVLLVPLGITLLIDQMLASLRQPHRHTVAALFRTVPQFVFILSLTLLTFFLLEPYALIDSQTFLRHTVEQSQMTKSAFTFPYTLQYVGKIAYLYELKNIILYGLGPLLAWLSLSGIVLMSFEALRKEKTDRWAKELILMVFFWVYFLIVGSFAIGFMRYMLPLYPILAIAGAFYLSRLYLLTKQKLPQSLLIICSLLFALCLFIWPLSFLAVYSGDNTRIQATEFIHRVIPAGKTIAIEHWDDALPLIDQAKYRMLTLNLYDPDAPEKWHVIEQQLDETDYIILASNRLYTPLMRLTDCGKLPPDRCYTKTASYYRALFDGSLGFTKVADITSHPTIPLTNIRINDQGADESFTVYDHPRIMIFQKIQQ